MRSSPTKRGRGRPPQEGLLTPRQREVLDLLVTGLTNQEIASQLDISEEGVKYHVSEILRRLAVDNRHDAVAAYSSPGERRWFGGFAPLAFLRDLPLPWLPKVIAGGAIGATSVGIGLLIWGVVVQRTDNDADGRSRGAVERTGNAPVDDTIARLLQQDIDGLMASIAMTSIGCSVEQTIGSPPACAPGVADGTPVDAFPVGYCEGTWLTQTGDVRAAFGAAISRQPTVALYAILRGDGAGDTSGYTIAATEDVSSQATAPVSFWRLNEDGQITGLANECGWYGAAQQIDARFPSAEYVAGPYINCQPGPGEYANVIVTVDRRSPGSSRPQFVGPAASTLGVPTNERAIVDVLPDTQWIGSITRLEDARSGMQLQTAGRRDQNCIIRAATILSPVSVPITSAPLGFEASYPYGWSEDAAPFPYASCVGCVTLGPPDVPYPYGIQIYTQPSDPGCDPACYFGIRAIAIDGPRSVTIDGVTASTQEIQRQAPLGVTGENGDTTPYRQIATVIHRSEGALLVVGFFREGDQHAEQQTRAACDAFLEDLRFMGSTQ